jgi:hypothetical protein
LSAISSTESSLGLKQTKLPMKFGEVRNPQ